MRSDDEICAEGMALLMERLGPSEATRFVTLVKREGFDYARWRQNLFPGKTIEEIAALATPQLRPTPLGVDDRLG